MKKGSIIQGIKTKLLCQFRFYTILRVFSFLLYRRGLWLSSELVGPFSIAIGYLTEFFSPEMGLQVFKSFLPLYSLL